MQINSIFKQCSFIKKNYELSIKCKANFLIFQIKH